MSFAERDERTIMSCCAVGCTNRFNKFNKTRKFYRIPSTRTPLKANRRRRWLQAIRRSDWNEQMIKNATICSDHFISVFNQSILMKLRLGLSNKDIAFRFNVTQCDISKILRSWLPVLSQTLKPLIKWPSKHAILKNMPNCTQALQEQLHLCPQVGVGRVSDKQITAESGFYDLLEVNDEILADRGFTIRDELALCGATLRIPHFTRGKKQLSAQEVETSRRLSNVRIHIERIIGRWKTF
ncbi:THAP domain-containing protein 1 [Merluccius polli]|uniref:THAP domain-containing protein 1 n=1 Tax=Merluccius polli TaxID=89951 RepID=A0AA47NWX7_MERPO|nr:THAP domain-containing protein 1 [Merluccius polli]